MGGGRLDSAPPAPTTSAMLRRTLLVIALFAGAARGDEIDSPLVVEGLGAYEALDFPRAVDLLERALAETLTRDETIATFRTLALCHVALDRFEDARRDFERLLRVDPTFALDRTVSPRVRAALDEARAANLQREAALPRASSVPTLAPELEPQHPEAGRPLTVRVTYPGGVAHRLQVFYRVAGEPAFNWLSATERDGRFTATLPGAQVRAPGLELYFALQDEVGAPLAGAGSAGEPLSVAGAAPAPPPRPLYRRPWFWGVLGSAVAVVAAAVGLGFGLARGDHTEVTILPH